MDGGKTLGSLACLAWLAASLFAPGDARADAAAMSRFHYDRAGREYAAGHYEEAVSEFFESQRLSPSPRTVYNVGLCFLQLRRDEDAYLFLSEYLEGRDDANGAAERRRFAERKLRELEARVARVRVVSEPEGARIFVDQAEHGVWGVTPRVLALPAGRHHVWVEVDGYRRAEVEVVATRGREVEAALAPERILGRVDIRSTPPGHVRLLDARGRVALEGDAPLDEALAPGSYRVEIRAPGHRLYARELRVTGDATSRVAAQLEDLPRPRSSLTVTADVENAVVELDGLPVGFTPLAAPALGVGEHRVSVSAPGRLEWRGTLSTSAARPTWVRVRLAEPPRARGALLWGLGGLSLALSAAGLATGVAALRAHDEFGRRADTLEQGDLRGLRARGRRLAFTTDGLLGGALLLAATTLSLRFVFGSSGVRESTADITGGAPAVAPEGDDQGSARPDRAAQSSSTVGEP